MGTAMGRTEGRTDLQPQKLGEGVTKAIGKERSVETRAIKGK